MRQFYLQLLLPALLLLSTNSFAQQQIWHLYPSQQLSSDEERKILPKKFLAFQADTSALQQKLMASPHERDVSPAQSDNEISLPDPDGNWHNFKIVAYDLMEAPLQEKWWYIHTWRGVSTDDPYTTIRLDWTDRGFHAMVRGTGDTWFIDPYYWNEREIYQVHYKKDYPAPGEPFECHTESDREIAPEGGYALRAGDCQLRQYRLALACTGEYADFHGGTVAGAASAMATTMSRVNGIYEEDLAMRLVLVANNNNLIYLDGSTDPYTNSSGSTMLGQNQSNCDAVIGTANYDIGHVFSTGGGGIATLQSPCRFDAKARGVTGQSNPVGDPFDVDYVAHEMGHQFGGNHTQNNNCNRAASASMEPGSASTIMGYAGICNPNVQSNSDDYYHGVNIQEIANYMESGFGNSCATIIDMSNSEPTIVAGQDYDIPGGTPFVLTGNATDPDGDPITYCWEQYDNEVGEAMPPLATNTQGPMFRSFDPTSSPMRYFPRLSDLVNNVDPTWETLPETNRDMDFRVTVRDFDGTYGCTTEDNITLSVDNSAGPFLVTTPNTNVTWFEGTQETVSWDVAGTASAPISCSNVDISLSYDGGFTYTTVLLNTPNDGSQTITVPGGTTTNARIMVRCSDNVFFDISNTDFTIDAAAAPDYTLTYSGIVPEECEQSSGAFNFIVNTTSIGGYSDPLDLSVDSAPLGVNVSFSADPINPGDDVTVTVSNISGLSPGSYTVTIRSTSNVGNKIEDLDFTIFAAPPAPALIQPADGNTDEELFPAFSWNSSATATNYTFELAEDAGFNNIVTTINTSSTSLTLDSALDGETVYYWRVGSGNAECGTIYTSAERSFETEPCYYYSSSGIVTISDGPAANYTSTISIPHSGTIEDVDLINLDITHTWVEDLRVELESPTGTLRRMFDYDCGNADDVLLSFDDEAGAAVGCPRNTGDKVQPQETLSAFDSESMSGDWILRVRDNANLDGGSINEWNLKICANDFSILPVEWLSFTAKAEKEVAILRWQTAAETDNAGFDLERRSEFETEFKPISWIDATQSPAPVNDYYYEDATVKSGTTYYYRIRQQDYSGEFDYSEIRSVQIKGNSPQWEVFPNPLKDNVSLRVWNTDQDVEAHVLNSQGQVLMKMEYTDSAAQLIDMSPLPAGVYWLQVRTGSWMETIRLLKL